VNPRIVIDGYNLLYATGILSQGADEGTLAGARRALLGWLCHSLPDNQRARTVVVFDAHNPPPGLADKFDHQGLQVHFARGYENADALIEQYVDDNNAPRQLTVVSSDHRVQRSARRRKATAVDSDAWYRQQGERVREQPSPASDKPEGKLSAGQVESWLEFFGEE
jgi:hypothetical protein